MSKKIVAVRDSKTEVFGSPVVCQNLAEGERMFQDVQCDQGTLISKHPEDFALWCLGDFDEVTGALVPCQPFVVVTGFKKSE